MKFHLGVTDNNWFDYLSQLQPAPEDINFWQPGGKQVFKAIPRGAPFFFKLKKPRAHIGGVGFFSSHTFLPLSMAWETFGERNGCRTFAEFRGKILGYRKDKENINPMIGCIVLTSPIFFPREAWVPVPESWSKSIVQGKGYSTETLDGLALWNALELRIQSQLAAQPLPKPGDLLVAESDGPLYREAFLSKVRVGQGAFRVLVTDAYQRRCSITGEKTLPVLEAAHIKSYASSGPHAVSNGILLRSDMHKLFDSGYLTVTTDHKAEVSSRIREEFQNGKEYYKYHGQSLLYLPAGYAEQPAGQFVQWHNENVFRG